MEITKVTLRPVAMNKVCAIASIVIDDSFVIHDLRVVNGDKGLFVAMPSRKLPNGDFRDICHPINTESRTEIQRAVLAQFALDGGVDGFAQRPPKRAKSPATDPRATAAGHARLSCFRYPRCVSALTLLLTTSYTAVRLGGRLACYWGIVQRQDSGFWCPLSRFESWCPSHASLERPVRP